MCHKHHLKHSPALEQHPDAHLSHLKKCPVFPWSRASSEQPHSDIVTALTLWPHKHTGQRSEVRWVAPVAVTQQLHLDSPVHKTSPETNSTFDEILSVSITNI
ncbi:hypothetical protein NQD34_005842 [Periophthalmus magnuspinnatus]|nr:hypothetical protein NQD34_005842 [Periophthalmus magnuspinnatus]